GRCRLMSAADVRTAMPTLRAERALGGVAYWDAQFDDAALAVALARTAILHGALVLNHCALESFALDG
ncbi:MAG TPA: FAD-dependent oxidoreductase, partial [Thauera sp.]|nr:FAD-dependent oxidoreductase [Thauera sp.]